MTRKIAQGEELKTKKFLKTLEVCRYLAISPSTFYRWKRDGTLPEGKRMSGKTILWSRETIDALFKSNEGE